MTFSVNVSGHTNDEAEEARVVEAFRAAVDECGDCVTSAVAVTTGQGQVDLRSDSQPVDEPQRGETE